MFNNAKQKREVVVITGASAGVGRATVREFARHGAVIGLLARGEDGLAAAVAEVEAVGGKALAIPTDVADPEQVEIAARMVEECLGPIDVWVNNAMVTVFAPVKKMTPEEFKRVTDVTYLGAVYGTLEALKYMLPRDHGTIVQVGSALAYRSIPLQSAYCAAKHALLGFTDSLRSELIHDGNNVHVTMVHLPAVNTPQFEWSRAKMSNRPQPVGPIFQPEVAAEAIWFAAHHRRREVWVGGPTVLSIVGQKLAPRVGDWYLGKAGYAGQQTDEPVSPRRRDNLWEPVPGDHGAHGPFDARSTERSVQLWLSRNRGWLAAAGGVAAAGFVALAWRGNGRLEDSGASADECVSEIKVTEVVEVTEVELRPWTGGPPAE